MSSRPLPSETRPIRLAAWLMVNGAIATCGSVVAADSLVRLEFVDAVRGGGQEVRLCVSIDDGGVVQWCEPGETQPRRGEIGDEQQAELLQEIVENLDIDSLETDTIWTEIVAEGRRTGLSPHIEGAGATRITVMAPDTDGAVVVECPACRLLATRYPSVESLQRFARCQCRLENLRAIMQVGGFDESRRLTDLANVWLTEQGHAGNPLTCRELCFVRGLPGGAKLVTYHWDGISTSSLQMTLEPGLSPVFQMVE